MICSKCGATVHRTFWSNHPNYCPPCRKDAERLVLDNLDSFKDLYADTDTGPGAIVFVRIFPPWKELEANATAPRNRSPETETKTETQTKAKKKPKEPADFGY